MSGMVELKTAELIGPALDWAVAYGLNGEASFLEAFGEQMLGRSITKETIAGNIRPSSNWSQCGPLIERHAVNLMICSNGSWMAKIWDGGKQICMERHDSSQLIAACRAIVSAKLGDVVSVPAELVQGGAQ